MLKKWFEEWRKRSAERQFSIGFDWAAGQLLRGTPPQDVDNALEFQWANSAFDYGAQAAVNAWEARDLLHRATVESVRAAAPEGCCEHSA